MATYTRELLAPLHARLEAQATQIGRLENEVEHLRAQLAAREATSSTNGVAHDDQAAEIVTTTAAPETRSAPPVGQKGRPRSPSWWRRLFGD